MDLFNDQRVIDRFNFRRVSVLEDKEIYLVSSYLHTYVHSYIHIKWQLFASESENVQVRGMTKIETAS